MSGSEMAAGAMALSSLSVVTNADRLRRYTPSVIAADGTVSVTETVVEIGSDDQLEETMSAHTTVTDPVCGMSVKPAHSAASAEHEGSTYYFCSHGCHAAFTADPSKHLPSGEHTHAH